MSLKSLAIATWISLQSAGEPPKQCLKTCEPSDAAFQIIRTFEGFSPFPYVCPAGKLTVGYGHVLLPGEKFSYPLLPQDSDTLLKSDARGAQKGVNRRVAISLWQNQFDALLSFVFNVGEGGFAKSTLLKRVNAERHSEVPAEFNKWVNGGGKPLPGLVMRRRAEAEKYREFPPSP